MKPHEFIGIAVPATGSALGAVGLWLIVGAVLRLSADPGGLLIQNIATVLHPGVWYVLAALLAQGVGRTNSE
ncbi:hypothetical protein [Methylobacterium sp. J-070]|uniref:hypothetical protein n=1 Tax=Methylobacterium sp. J-070 TaxID=2836650 RepID=UPI001FB8A3B7|nr:hypothetical protein [Methylobacterium sp. J-070]MCJ2053446.1 hypothetical protein [Methylobacterium sp. J-070]